MGRNEPSHAPMAQQGFRKDQRAKHARFTINKSIPQILASDARARKGIENAYLSTGTSDGSNSTNTSTPSKPDLKSKRSQRSSKNGKLKDAIESDEPPQPDARRQNENVKPANCRIQVTDTLMAAHELHTQSRSKKNVAILNMASPLRPGGGVLNGATSQEESLCSRTTLLPSLKEEWYRLPELGAIWSPDVLVFRVPTGSEQADLPKADRFYVDVVSAAMTRFPDTLEKAAADDSTADEAEDENGTSREKVYANQKDRDVALQKMRRVLELVKIQGTERIVLGAWGCGAYGNPTSEIARAWKRALLGANSRSSRLPNSFPDLGKLKEVVFAIKDSRMAEEFALHWGDDISVEHKVKNADTSSDSDPMARQIDELKQKIGTLQVQISEVQTPLLRQGLQNTMNALQKQLEAAQQEPRSQLDDSEDEDD